MDESDFDRNRRESITDMRTALGERKVIEKPTSREGEEGRN